VDPRAALEPEDFAPHPPPGPAIPAPGEIHLWTIPLDPPTGRVAALRLQLTPDETARADRFHFDHHRRRFTVGRGALRELLAAYLDAAPEEVHFVYGEKGKPSLDGPAAAGDDLRFNLSNSHELALVAVGVGHELGVDVERLRPIPDGEQIAERFFSPGERMDLAGLPPTRRDEGFFNGWTRKEAYLKAMGDGLTVALDRFDVTLTPGRPARFRTLDGSAEAASRWSLFDLHPAPGYVGALAVPDPGPWRLQGWQWQP